MRRRRSRTPQSGRDITGFPKKSDPEESEKKLIMQTNGPKFIRYFGPVIDALKQLGGSGRPAEVRDLIAQNLKISEQEQSELLAAGGSRYENQIHWARF